MHLLRLGCFVLLLTLSSPGNALIDGYYSQAVDIDYALPGEDESIRVTLERAIKRFLEMVNLNDDQPSMGLNLDYYNSDEDMTSGR